MMHIVRLICAAMLLACPFSVVRADEERMELTVEAGPHDRTNCPVRVVVNPLAAWKDADSLVLAAADGQAIPGQLTSPGLLHDRTADESARELHFILPKLDKGESLTLTVQAAAPSPTGFAWQDAPGRYYSELNFDGRPVLRYVYPTLDAAEEDGDTFFKVFHHLYDPTGSRFVTKGDKDGLFPHHRGLFFGFSRITYGETKANTWACSKGNRQSHEGFLASEAGPVVGRHLLAIDWHGPDQRVFVREHRELAAYHAPGGQMVEFASRLASTAGKVQLDGDPHHAGFHFRAAQEVADRPEGTYYLRPDGKGAPGEFRNWSAKAPDPRCVNLPWYAASFEIGPKRYTAVYVNRPANPGESRYGERDYARFGCYFEYELNEGRDLLVGYRLWVQEGEMTVEQAAAVSADFAEPPVASVRTFTCP